jgi:hypothetical protein
LASASKARATSDLLLGALCESGSNVSDPKLNELEIPDKFFRINF